tara:strand:+ start:2309 stop:2494 length:186 start_codon:yes stop_codon:yes gene_type:complete
MNAHTKQEQTVIAEVPPAPEERHLIARILAMPETQAEQSKGTLPTARFKHLRQYELHRHVE